jgi:hypothetical protein
MKRLTVFIALLFILSSSKCKKEGDNCHYGIVITNKSSSKVIYSKIGTLATDSSKCLLSKRAELQPNESYEETLRMSWEVELTYRNLEFYIVDPANFNQGGFYNCDSIEQYNRVLKHYALTLDNLKAMNFTVTYP